jgi:hypothetical protein
LSWADLIPDRNKMLVFDPKKGQSTEDPEQEQHKSKQRNTDTILSSSSESSLPKSPFTEDDYNTMMMPMLTQTTVEALGLH